MSRCTRSIGFHRSSVSLSETLEANPDAFSESLPQHLREWAKSEWATPMTSTITLGYDRLTVEQVLRQMLPPEIKEVPTGFETAGHVAHLNLRDDLLPFKRLIARVILDKNARLRSVVNKTASIATQFRTFPMELLAGDPDLTVELKEHGATFRFDFSKVPPFSPHTRRVPPFASSPLRLHRSS